MRKTKELANWHKETKNKKEKEGGVGSGDQWGLEYAPQEPKAWTHVEKKEPPTPFTGLTTTAFLFSIPWAQSNASLSFHNKAVNFKV